jgi:hypothetical protein
VSTGGRWTTAVAGGFGAQVGVVVDRVRGGAEAFLDDVPGFLTLISGTSARWCGRGFLRPGQDGFSDDQDACPDQAEDFDGFDDFWVPTPTTTEYLTPGPLSDEHEDMDGVRTTTGVRVAGSPVC